MSEWPRLRLHKKAPLPPPTAAESGHIRVWYVPTIADPAAPTIAEMNAGVDLECTARAPWYLRRGFMPSGLSLPRRLAWKVRARFDRWGLRRAMRRS